PLPGMLARFHADRLVPECCQAGQKCARAGADVADGARYSVQHRPVNELGIKRLAAVQAPGKVNASLVEPLDRLRRPRRSAPGHARAIVGRMQCRGPLDRRARHEQAKVTAGAPVHAVAIRFGRPVPDACGLVPVDKRSTADRALDLGCLGHLGHAGTLNAWGAGTRDSLGATDADSIPRDFGAGCARSQASMTLSQTVRQHQGSYTRPSGTRNPGTSPSRHRADAAARPSWALPRAAAAAMPSAIFLMSGMGRS